MNNIEKSNRAKADLFELLFATLLIDHYSLKNDYSSEVNEIKKFLLKFPDNLGRINEQETRAKELFPFGLEILEKEIQKRGNIIKIEWIGRIFNTTKSLADLNITFKDRSKIGISLKSVGNGTGTQKNLGYKTIKQYLGVDLDNDLENMWKNIKKRLTSLKGNYARLASLPKTQIKKNKYKFSKINKVGEEFGFPVQKRATEESVDKFNKLPAEKKVNFLKLLLGYKTDEELVVFIISGHRIIAYSNKKYIPFFQGEMNIKAVKIEDKSYGLFIDDKLILRIQSSFTNGIGISAFCQRAFLDNI